MKTQKNNSLKVVTKITFLVTLLIVVSCKSKEDSIDGATSVSQAEVKPPHIDIHTASFFCRPEIVKMLLDKGVDKTIKNKFGSTAYESVAGSFSDVKNTYEMMVKMLAPMAIAVNLRRNFG